MSGNDRIALNYMPHVAELVTEAGGDVSAWLQTVGLNRQNLNDTSVEISVADYLTLLEAAIAISGEPGFGLRLGYRLTPVTHSFAGLAATASGSIAKALAIAEEFSAIRTSLISFKVQQSETEYRLELSTLPGLGKTGFVILETAMISLKTIADTISTTGSVCQQICFAMPAPAHKDLAAELFQCPVHYEQSWNGLSFLKEDAERTMPQRDTLVLSEALAVCRRELQRVASSQTTTARVQRLVLDHKSGFPSVEVAADLMNMTPRTLHRRLAAEDASYSEIVDEVRSRLAREYLQTNGLSVQETAFQLGYTDAANFRRAFKRWFGQTPSDYLRSTDQPDQPPQ